MGISLSQETKLVIGQQMYTSLSFLQMGALELEERLQEMSMENVMLEEIEGPQKEPPLRSGLLRKSKSGTMSEMPIPDQQRTTLKMFLTDQLTHASCPAEIEKAIRFLILNLDDRGYLSEELCQTTVWQKQRQLFQAALQQLQQMDPPGVGARNLKECLLLQLERAGEKDSLAAIICENYLEHLGKHHFNYIAGALNVSEAAVQEALLRLRALAPYPANGFDDGPDPVWVRPDVEVVLEDHELVVRTLDEYLPHYAISSYYVSLLSSGELKEEDERYLKEKLREAKGVLNFVYRRSETTLLCAKAIVERQRQFFLYDPDSLNPCSMTELAAALGIHPSTVSRAVRDKYILCRWGTVPMADFFQNEVSGDTAWEITQRIQEMISDEDPYHPLSDNAISERLAARGYNIARRTVAKYREAAMIPPATGRKKRT